MYVELCMDMNTSYNNTNRLFPLGFGILRRTTAYILVGVPQGEGQGDGVSGTAVCQIPLICHNLVPPIMPDPVIAAK